MDMFAANCQLATRNDARRKIKRTVVIFFFFPNCFLLSLSQSWAIAFQSPEKEETYLSSPALLLFSRCEASLEHAGLY